MNNFSRLVVIVLPLFMLSEVFADTRSYRSSLKNKTHATTTLADVVSVEPYFRRVRVEVPRKECWEEEVVTERRRGHRHHRSDHGVAGATIAGGLIGGVLGRQIGGGSGRDAMTVVGAVLGSSIANDRAQDRREESNSQRKRYQDVQIVERCETTREIREEERIDGYLVTYVYGGNEYTTHTQEDPGAKIRIRVAVTPAE